MPIPVDSRLTNAVTQWMARNNSSVYALANFIGITRTSIFSWINGTVKTVSDETWAKASPFLSPYYDASAPALPVRPDSYGDAVRANAVKAAAAEQELREEPSAPYPHARRWPPVGAPKPWGAQMLDELTEDVEEKAQHPSEGADAILPGYESLVRVQEWKGKAFGHHVSDDNSMAPTIRNGDRLACLPGLLPVGPSSSALPMSIAEKTIKDGEIIACSTNGGQSTMITRARWVTTGRSTCSLWLEVDNAAWSEANEFPRCISRESDLIVYGTVIGRVVNPRPKMRLLQFALLEIVLMAFAGFAVVYAMRSFEMHAGHAIKTGLGEWYVVDAGCMILAAAICVKAAWRTAWHCICMAFSCRVANWIIGPTVVWSLVEMLK